MVVYPNSAAMYLAGLVRTALAGAKLKLYTAIANPLGPGTVKADFTEATFDGYVTITIAAWLAIYIDPAGGASFQSGTHQFDYGPAAVPPITNTILGFWIENAAGALICAGNFAAPIAMTVVGDSLPVNVTLNYGRS